ncbi:MAG TPA: hypothetical protein VK907_05595, partial [Phnomibacter sp.]|nr:hypothetical protein [Phnomibacter sp.]
MISNIIRTISIFLLGLFGSGASFSQTLTMVDSSHPKTSYRGLSIARDGSIWVSGSQGTIGKSTDEGKTWQWVNSAGSQKRDFRDVLAFDAQHALALAVDSP